MLVLSQHVEISREPIDLVSAGGFGDPLKDRVLDVDDFIAAVSAWRAGGSALDPQVVAPLVVGAAPTTVSLSSATREREVLAPTA